MTADSGLEDIVATSTTICSIENGVLAYRGIAIEELAEKALFDEVAYLLLYAKLPTREELGRFEMALAEGGRLQPEALDFLRKVPTVAMPMDWLRTVVSAMSFWDPDTGDNSVDANMRKAVRLTGMVSSLVAAFDRLRNGKEPLAPRLDKSLAWNFLYMLRGKEPDEESVHVFDVCLTLHAEHELNASTFAARVTAATLNDMYSSVTSAIGALKGTLHGGANKRVMRMLEKIGDPAKAESWVREALARKERIMGFGHRVYKNGDPRAAILKKLSEKMGRKTGDMRWCEISCVVDAIVQKEKKILPNVDFYSASVYHYLGIPTDLFTLIFACSRIAGWAAHVNEQLANNRLIRPRAEYTGLWDQHVVPIDQR
jgi:citrate synthase